MRDSNKGGRWTRVVGIGHECIVGLNIADSSTADVKRRGHEGLLEGVLNSSHDGIMAFRAVRNECGSVVDFEWSVINPAAAAIVGRAAADLVGRRLLEEMPGNAESGLFDRYVEVVESGRAHSIEHHYQHERLDNWFYTTAVKLDDGFTVTFRDVTEHKRLQKALESQAFHDPLTGLPNRLLFEARIEHALAQLQRRGVSLAVLFIDLDRFKVVNDGLGRAAGDALLVQVGQRLQAAARPTDTVARFGGDEFVILCEDLASDHDAGPVGRRILALTQSPFHIGGRDITVTVSVGVSTANCSDADPAQLVQDADTAMNKAKASGGGCVEFFNDALRRQVVARLDIEVDLRHAINHGELRVFYQPIVSITDDRIVAAEALVRWQHPRHGLLAPGRFLRVAEETGLIVPIGAWVLEQAVDQLADWQQGLTDVAPTYVTVNVAGAQLATPGFADFVVGVLSDADIEPQALCLEVTETSLIRDPITAEMTLHQLAAHGIKIALDDFGTGYSAIAHLQRFPVDVIKIDRSFIEGLEHSSGDRAVVTAIIALAKSLGKTTVAEGLETAAQLAILDQLGGDLIQGYYFSPPETADKFTALLNRSRHA